MLSRFIVMAKTKTIRSLERGLKVLRALQQHPISSLHEIKQLTGLPKPTLLRILRTLENFGAVSRRLADGHYRISATLAQLARKPDRYDQIAEAAAPVLDRLCRKISWPSDLLVPAGDHMEIRETSRVQTPFSTVFLHDRIGTPVNWLLSAVGRAYLAYCPEKERNKILALLRKSELPENRLARDEKRVRLVLKETQMKGYGTRDLNFDGGAYRRQAPDGLAGIAVPLLDGNRVHGVINIVWPKAAKTVENMVGDHLADLKNAASEIITSLRNQSQMQ
jgi:IclR family transcriptional regulator, mhp operon transcriptional activator